MAGCPLEKFLTGQVMIPAAQAAHLGLKQRLIEKEKIRPVYTQAEQLGEPGNRALHRLRQQLRRLVAKAEMCIY